MDLKSFLPNNKSNEKAEHFWSVIVEPKSVQAGIWKVTDGKTEVVSRSPLSAWEELEELINATDTVLTSAVSELDEDIDPEKAVFGVMSSWVKDGQITSEHLDKIRKLCAELSLKPAGFVVLSEAISNYLKAEEGSPLSGVIIGVSKESLELSVFKLGNLLGSTTVARSISIVEDVAEGLTRFADSKGVPSRFILYDGKEGELEELRQELVKANWDDFNDIKFLHTPHVEILTTNQKIDAVSLAGAVDIAGVSQLVGSSEKSIGTDDHNIEAVSPEELGFALGEDITTAMGDDIDPLKDKPSGQMVINDPLHEVDQVVSEPAPPVIPPEELPEPVDEISRIPKVPLKNKISGMTGLFSKLSFKKKSKSSGKDLSAGKKALIIGSLFFVLLIGGGFAMWWYYPKATVTLYLTTNQLEERIEVTVDPNATSSNISSAILPGKVLSTSVSGDKSAQTTGKTTVGDRATGSVTLYRVGTEVSLPSDTVITSSGLEFTLDSSAKVASGSASTPGKTDVDVTAALIGDDYNLASGTTFQVDGYSLSDIEAKNGDAFTGGSSREINAVSEDDQENLQNDLEKELQEMALSELKKDLSSNDCTNCVLIAESTQVTDSTADFNKKVGDEADSLSLSLEQEIQVLAINNDDLITLARSVLDDRIPNGYVLRDDQIEVDFEFEKEDDGKYILKASVKANLFSEVNPEDIAKQISGKYPEVAESYLINNIPGFVRAQINLRPRLRGKLGTLPHVSGNIEVEIAADR